MCGIHGIISHSLSADEIQRRLDKMGDLQRHRGPDDKRENVFQYKNSRVGFGLVRLSILDLETGMQPIICEKDNSAIICNGQIYNYIEIRHNVAGEPFATKGDIEVALHLYRKKGVNFLQYLNGMYAGAVYDPVNRKVILFRDRFGIKPLYYTVWDDNFVFSSEIKPLLAGSQIPKILNQSLLATFFTYRYVPGEQTLFTGIKRLPPGSFLEYQLDSGVYTVKRYWEYRLDNIDPNLSLDDAAEQFNDIFSDAVRIRLRSDVEVGSLVSGGIDSSAVASQAATLKPGIKLFTMSFKEDKYNELPQVRHFLNAKKDRFKTAEQYTRLCGKETLDQLPNIISSLEEPVSLGTVLPTDQVCEMASDHLKVVLTGEGADEIFAGYRKFQIETAAYHYNELSPEHRKRLNAEYPELEHYMTVRDKDPSKRYIQSEQLYSPDDLKLLLGCETNNTLFPENAIPALSGSEHPLNAAIAFESRARLPDYVILRLDKLSMRHSLETRTPFLDFRLAEFAATLPVNFKVNLDNMREKYICSHAYSLYGILDHETAFRKKLPFTIPLADWLSEPSALPEFLQDILLGDVIDQQGILDPDIVKQQVKTISTDGIGPQTLVSDADRIFAVIIFSLWYDAFFA